MSKHLIVWLVLLGGLAFGHAYLETSTPGQSSTIAAAPREIVLGFSEPLELKLSKFKVYRIPAAENFEQAIALAQQIIPTAISNKKDAAQRFDLTLATQSKVAANVRLKMKSKMPKGYYLVMWKVLSIDGHITTDGFVFRLI